MTSGASVPRPVSRLHQLVPAGRGEEHQPRVGHRLTDQSRPLEIDLQEDRLARLQTFEHGPAGRAVAIAA